MLCHLLWWLIKVLLSNWSSWEKGRWKNKEPLQNQVLQHSEVLVPFSMCSLNKQPDYTLFSCVCSMCGSRLYWQLFKPCAALKTGLLISSWSFFFIYHSSIWVLIIVEPKHFTNINLSLQHSWEERAAPSSLFIQRGWQCAQMKIKTIQ